MFLSFKVKAILKGFNVPHRLCMFPKANRVRLCACRSRRCGLGFERCHGVWGSILT